MTDCYFHHTKPLAINWLTFHEATLQQLTLHVPSGYKEQYATAEYWKDFKDIVDDIPVTAISPIWTNKGSNSYFDIRGNRIEKPGRGITIIRKENGQTVKVFRRN